MEAGKYASHTSEFPPDARYAVSVEQMPCVLLWEVEGKKLSNSQQSRVTRRDEREACWNLESGVELN
jgi:hypothetical protein